jgi:hypothetical protein
MGFCAFEGDADTAANNRAMKLAQIELAAIREQRMVLPRFEKWYLTMK